LGRGTARRIMCDKRMIVTDGFDLDPEFKAFECRQCGHTERPASPKKTAQAE
jgi:hypothetical protein